MIQFCNDARSPPSFPLSGPCGRRRLGDCKSKTCQTDNQLVQYRAPRAPGSVDVCGVVRFPSTLFSTFSDCTAHVYIDGGGIRVVITKMLDGTRVSPSAVDAVGVLIGHSDHRCARSKAFNCRWLHAKVANLPPSL